MKTLCLTILSLLFVVAVRGQSPGNPTQINNTRYYSFKQFLGSDSAYLMAQRDTNWTPTRPAMIFRPGDSTVYYWNLRYWTAFAKAAGSTNLGIYLLKANFIDSLNNNRQQLSKLGDTVYLSFGGKVNVMPDTTTKVATINFVKNQGYIVTETDPVFKGSPAFGITTININNWNSAFNNATFDSVSKKLRLFAINGAQDSLVINSVLATNFNPVSHDSTIIMQGTGRVYGDTLRVSVDTTRSGIATHNWTLGQGFIKSETDPVATSKTITMVNGSGVTIFGSPTQTLGSNPTWTFKADTGLVATLAALGDSVVNKKHWDSAFVKVKFDTSSRVLTMYDFKNDSAIVVIPKGGTQNGMVAINTIRYGDILKIYADNGASTEITINNQDSLTRAHFSDTLTYLYPLKSNPAKYIPLTALSALVPLSYVNTTGVFSVDTSGAANGVATINYVNRQGYVKTETDPVATAKTVTVTQGTGITVTGASQTVGSNPAFTVAAQNTTAIWNANQLQGTPVSTTPPSTNQLLQYNGTNWIGVTPSYAPAFTVTTPLTYASNVLGEDTTTAAHGMASINYVNRIFQPIGSYALTNGSNATGTWPISITGNAVTWAFQQYGGQQTNPITDLMSYDVTSNSWHYTTAPLVQSFLGLGSNAYTSTAYLPLAGGTLTGVAGGQTLAITGGTTGGVVASDIGIKRSGIPIYTIGQGAGINFGNSTDNTNFTIQETSGAGQFFTNTPTQGWKERFRIDTLGQVTDFGLLSAPFVATNSAGTFIPAAYTPYNPASYPVNAGGETLLSVTNRASTTPNTIQITGNTSPLSGRGLELRAAAGGSSGDILSYDRTNNTYIPLLLHGGSTPTGNSTIILNGNGIFFQDKDGITHVKIDTVGDLLVNNPPPNIGSSNPTYSKINVNGGILSSGGYAAQLAFGDRVDSLTTQFVWYSLNNKARLYWFGATGSGDMFTVDSIGNANIFGDSLTINNKSYSWASTGVNGEIRLNSSEKITNSAATSMPIQGVDVYTTGSSLEFDNPFNIIFSGNNNTVGGIRGNLYLNSSGATTNIFNDQSSSFAGLIGTVGAFNNANYGIVGVIGAQSLFTFTQSPYSAFTGHIDTAAQVILYKQSPSLNIDNKIGSPYGILQLSNYPNSYNGGDQHPIRSVSANTTATTADYTIIVTASATVTLPAAASCPGQIFRLISRGASTTLVTSINYVNYAGTSIGSVPTSSAATIQSDGTNWNQVGQ